MENLKEKFKKFCEDNREPDFIRIHEKFPFQSEESYEAELKEVEAYNEKLEGRFFLSDDDLDYFAEKHDLLNENDYWDWKRKIEEKCECTLIDSQNIDPQSEAFADFCIEVIF